MKYMVWQIDCERCGEVETFGEDDPGDECGNCGGHHEAD